MSLSLTKCEGPDVSGNLSEVKLFPTDQGVSLDSWNPHRAWVVLQLRMAKVLSN